MYITESQDLKVRSLRDEDDQLLSRWLSNPRILEYYEGRDRPHDLALVREHYYGDRDRITSGIIEYQGWEIGYVQLYIIDEEEREEYGYENNHETIFGMDQFIGEEAYWNKGIGTKLIEMMIRYLREQQQANKIVLDPQAWNLRAIHVYEKCGFTKKKLLLKHEWHEGEYRDCWLMEYDCK